MFWVSGTNYYGALLLTKLSLHQLESVWGQRGFVEKDVLGCASGNQIEIVLHACAIGELKVGDGVRVVPGPRASWSGVRFNALFKQQIRHVWVRAGVIVMPCGTFGVSDNHTGMGSMRACVLMYLWYVHVEPMGGTQYTRGIGGPLSFHYRSQCGDMGRK